MSRFPTLSTTRRRRHPDLTEEDFLVGQGHHRVRGPGEEQALRPAPQDAGGAAQVDEADVHVHVQDHGADLRVQLDLLREGAHIFAYEVRYLQEVGRWILTRGETGQLRGPPGG